MNYEELVQWRTLCEYLDSKWYKCADTGNHFPLLLINAREKREFLWSYYMIQLVQWCEHPHVWHHRRSPYKDEWVWRLLPGWEFKIDFLEKITLFNHAPEDLPQPWRKAIWEAYISRKTQALDQEELAAQIRRRYNENMQRHYEIMKKTEEELKLLDCVAGFRCRDMTGAITCGECPNYGMCRGLIQSL